MTHTSGGYVWPPIHEVYQWQQATYNPALDALFGGLEYAPFYEQCAIVLDAATSPATQSLMSNDRRYIEWLYTHRRRLWAERL